MILAALIAVLLLGSVFAWVGERWHPAAPRAISLATLALEAALLVKQYASSAFSDSVPIPEAPVWLADLKWAWVPRFGIHFHLALDGLSLLLIALTVVLGIMAISSSWTEIRHRQGFFYFNLLFCLSGTVGVFLAVDLFLFFFFWEVMILPMYFLISIWGHENRIFAGIKFFIFTQVSSLLMLLSIIALALTHQAATGVLSFDYYDLLDAQVEPVLAFWLMLGFFVAFTVKLPSVPFHTWLPDAHTQAPTGGSVILAGVMLKTGAYGLLRFVLPLFPEASSQFAPIAMSLGALSVLYAALMAFAQSDLKRLIAYTSVSHMGFVTVGIFSWNIDALQGSVVTMLAHGISAAALFMIAGALQERLHTREMSRMGGFWSAVPRMSAVALFFAIASLGLPGLGNFVGEFLVLAGAFKVSIVIAALTSIVLVLAPVYSLIVIQKVFHGPYAPSHPFSDYNRRELVSMGILILGSLWLGMHPQPLLNVAAPTLLQAMQFLSG